MLGKLSGNLSYALDIRYLLISGAKIRHFNVTTKKSAVKEALN